MELHYSYAPELFHSEKLFFRTIQSQTSTNLPMVDDVLCTLLLQQLMQMVLTYPPLH